jgi:enoyl-CoA hydratase/carnithine racemase
MHVPITAGSEGLTTCADDGLISLRRHQAVATLTLARPRQFNALSAALLAALTAQLQAIAADASIRVVVIAAQGKAFCAGHDLHEMLAMESEADYRKLFAACTRMMMAIQGMPQPVIAKVHGLATAAGCQLVAMCDLAIASSEATFAVSGVNLGLFCSTPSVALSRNLSRKQAFEMLVTGEFIDAEAAKRAGLINQVVAADQLDDSVDHLCQRIMSKPQVAISMGKQLFYRQLEMGIEAAYQLAGQTMACNMADIHTREGISAFVEKRSPRWAQDTNA